MIQPPAPGAVFSTSSSPSSSEAGSGCKSAQAERASKIDFAGFGVSSVPLEVGDSVGMRFRSRVSKSSSEFTVSASWRLSWRMMAALDLWVPSAWRPMEGYGIEIPLPVVGEKSVKSLLFVF